MSRSNPRSRLAAVRLIAAIAQKLADDLEHGRLWDGEYDAAIHQIRRTLAHAERD